MVGVGLRRCGQYITLEVPGLAEGRPSLLMGDRAIVSLAKDRPWQLKTREGEREGRQWEGYIHEVSVCVCVWCNVVSCDVIRLGRIWCCWNLLKSFTNSLTIKTMMSSFSSAGDHHVTIMWWSPYHVTVARTTFRRMHHAVEIAHLLGSKGQHTCCNHSVNNPFF